MLSPEAFDDTVSALSRSPQGAEEGSAAPRPATHRCGLVTDTDDKSVAPEWQQLLDELFGTSSEESAVSPTVAATAPAASACRTNCHHSSALQAPCHCTSASCP
eukprot:3187879-Pleurochrysis_carterae.AAC.1